MTQITIINPILWCHQIPFKQLWSCFIDRKSSQWILSNTMIGEFNRVVIKLSGEIDVFQWSEAAYSLDYHPRDYKINLIIKYNGYQYLLGGCFPIAFSGDLVTVSFDIMKLY